MHTEILTTRRRFLFLTGGLAAGVAVPAFPPVLLAAGKKESDVNPLEDLMREHGVLHRLLLIYDDAVGRLDRGKDVPSGVFAESAGIIRRFIEDYHERLEEDIIFPCFEKTGRSVDLVRVLYDQHQAGRRLTDSILQLSETKAVKDSTRIQDPSPAINQIYGGTPLFHRMGVGSYAKLALAVHQFIRMYRPHVAREDTVLFPALRSIMSPGDFNDLQKRFEDREMVLRQGFEKTLESVNDLEKKLGIDDLSKFTRETTNA